MNATAAPITEGARVTGLFHQNGQRTRITGTVVSTYGAELHGFTVPMVVVACPNGRRRSMFAGSVHALPIERRYVRVMQPAAGEPGWANDELFEGTLADFMAAFGVTEAQGAHHSDGEAHGMGAEGLPVVVTWSAA